jgi:hypothetical protein
MAPTWLTVLAWISLAASFVCAGLIAVEIFVIHEGAGRVKADVTGPGWWLAPSLTRAGG